MGTLNPNGPEATTQNPNGKYPDSLIEQRATKSQQAIEQNKELDVAVAEGKADPKPKKKGK